MIRKDLLRPNGPSYSENFLSKAISLNYQVRHENVSFFCPFSGAPKSESPLLPSRATAFRERHKKYLMGFQKICWEETGKAEGAKVLGTGIGPEAVPRKNEQQKKAGL